MMSRLTGRSISTIEHIKQSIQDILTTPIGSRIMRRTYGSLLPKLIDTPLNNTTILQCQVAAATAILQWENRISISTLKINQLSKGKLVFDMQIQLADDASTQDLQVPVNFGAAA